MELQLIITQSSLDSLSGLLLAIIQVVRHMLVTIGEEVHDAKLIEYDRLQLGAAYFVKHDSCHS
jgi:hypothetical protein